MIDTALAIVRDYINNIADNAEYSLFVVWQATVLQNFKCLITSTVSLGMCFDLTYDGEEGRWYLNVYQKVAQQEIAYGIQQ